MSDDRPGVPRLPEHPELREIAQSIEQFGIAAEILDSSFRCVFISTEASQILGLSASDIDALYGVSVIVRNIESDIDVMRATPEGAVVWWRHNVPIMRHYLETGTREFDEVFTAASENAARVTPVDVAPRAWHDTQEFPENLRFRRYNLGDGQHLHVRINDDTGRFIGVLWLWRGTLRDSVLWRLGRGDPGLFERMDRVVEPGRRPAGILFADLEASGDLSRRLSSRGYFDLIRDLTDLIDSAVITRSGIIGKHAGDGGSALFLTEDFAGSESSAARATIDAARAIRDGADQLGTDDVSVKLNIGVHWGATLMVGQVATRGRLEVTALGDQMNEGARIEAAAKGGAILASKDIIERLHPADAQATGIDSDAIAYTPLGELDGASDKAIRDAGAIPVTAI